MYPVIEISGDIPSQLEQLGTKAKFWFYDEHGKRILFKEGRPGTGENWAEKVCCEIAGLLELPHADYDFAQLGDRKGVISPTFVPEDGRLILGNELLARIHTGYDERIRYQASQHTLRRVFAGLEVFKPDFPASWAAPDSISNAFGVFIGYLMLDALVSNQDRHHENWGIINSNTDGLTLAPTFDHASSLGRNETDENRLDRLQSKDIGRGIEYYCSRAKSGLYKSSTDKKPMNTVSAFQEAVKIDKTAGAYWSMKLQALEIEDFELIFDQIPETEISESARLFALSMLEINRKRLLSIE